MSNDLIICAVVAAVFNRGIKYRILIQPPCIWYGLNHNSAMVLRNAILIT